MTNEQLIHQFYQSFQKRDYKGMQACYHEEAIFNDEAFKNLNSKEVKAMWEMFCSNPANEMAITYSDVVSKGATVEAEWRATYLFTLTGRRVENHIKAKFEFKDGKIVKHTDRFDFGRWAWMALGFKGLLVTYIPPIRTKFEQQVRRTLDKFMQKQQG